MLCVVFYALMISGIFFVAGNAMAIIVAIALARFGFRDREPEQRVFAAIAAYPLVATGAVALAGALGPITPRATLDCLAAPFVVSAIWMLRGRAAGRRRLDRGVSWVAGKDSLGSLIPLGLAGGLCAAWAWKTLVLGTAFHWDDLIYHAAIPAQWLLAEDLTLPTLSYQAYYPLNAEAFTLWFLLPWRSDAYASLAVFYWGLLAVAALARIARSLGHDWPTIGLVVSAFMVSRIVWGVTGSFNAADLAGAASILAAAALLLPAPERRTGPSLADALASGLLAGFALGCKVLYAAPALALAVSLACVLERGSPWRRRAVLLAGFGATLLLTGGGWYLRDWLLTGNPLFPAEVGPWEGPFDAAAQVRTRLATWLFATPFDAGLWFRVLQDRLLWPHSLALLSGLGFVSALVSTPRRPNDRGGRAMLLLLGGSVALIYPFLPFSGTSNRPHVGMHPGYLRFLLLPFASGLILFADWLGGDSPRRVLWGAVTVLAVATAWQHEPLLSFVAFAGAALLLVYRARLETLAYALCSSPARGLACAAVGLLLLALWAPYKQKLTDENLHTYNAGRGRFAESAGPAWRALETLPSGSRVAFFMSEPTEYTHFYPTFGRTYQLVPVPVDRDGAPRRLLHESWNPDSGPTWWSAWDRQGERLDTHLFRVNLAAAEVDYVLVSRWSLGEWPPQYEALRSSAGGEFVYDDGYSAIFRLGS